MKNLVITSLILLLIALIFSEMNLTPLSQTHEKYRRYAEQYGKSSSSQVQFIYRAQIFEEFLVKMEKHNSDPSQTWKIGVNQFSDLTQEEFESIYLGERTSTIPELKEEEVNAGFVGDIDWRKSGIVTAVKNQGQCGSCWAFGATAAHQSHQIQFLKQPQTINLSEQQLVDCSTQQPYGNHGCNGGLASRALEYIRDFGQTVTSEYPYMAINQPCSKSTGSFRISGVTEMTGCEVMESMIQRVPMAVRVDASKWSLYKSGIFNDCDTKLNHAVFLVGSNSQSWIIKNSWSASWGQNGYIRLAKGNTCGVCFGPSFPV